MAAKIRPVADRPAPPRRTRHHAACRSPRGRRAEHRELANSEALDALELGARRIDFVGLKFQNADECVSLYNQALAHCRATRAAGTKSATCSKPSAPTNGRLQDIRDGYALLGGLYRQAWLRVNRPYWLENNLARYDRAAQLWIDRGDRWSLVEMQWYEKHTLPSASDAGLPATH